MANNDITKATIRDVIKQNGENEITGPVLQQVLLSMVDSYGVGYQYVGIADLTTSPGTPDQNVFYIVLDPGIYPNFGSINVTGLGVLKWNGNWEYEPMNPQIQDYANASFALSDNDGAIILEIKNGHIITKNFDSGLMPETLNTQNYDFAISDEDGNYILAVKNGQIITKNFDSGNLQVKDDYTHDFALTDENGYVILAIKNGHIKTKHFDSENIEQQEEINLDSFRSKTGLMYSKFFNSSTPIADFVITGSNNSLTADGLRLTSAGGNIKLDKYFSIANRTIEYLCKFTAGSVARFTTDQSGPIITVDMVNHKFIIANNTVSDEITIDSGIESHLFKVLITKHYQEQIAKLIDVTVNKVYTVSKTQDGEGGAGQGSLNPNPTIIGMQNDKYVFYESHDVFFIKNIKIYANVNNVKLIMYGDSITEPESYYPKENFQSSWTQLVISQINGVAVSSGRGGTNIDAIFERISNELPFINAKYVMVTIGTNGGNTVAKLRQLVDYIKSCGAIPILNNIPCNDNNGTSNTAENNAMIQQVRTEKGIKGCLFNIATSENEDGETLDYSMMYYEDYPGLGTWYHHPNPKGAEAMFLRTLIDVPEIYD